MAVRFSKVKGTPYQVALLEACFSSFLLNKKRGGGVVFGVGGTQYRKGACNWYGVDTVFQGV